jgi:hypothetical protein
MHAGGCQVADELMPQGMEIEHATIRILVGQGR